MHNQKSLSPLLQDYWISEYSEDIFQSLKNLEQKARILYYRSHQTDFHRPLLLHLLKKTTKTCKLTRISLHLAVYLLDRFMDCYIIQAEKMNLTAFACLMVATKIEEAEVNMPKFLTLAKLVREAYTINDFKNAEFMLLTTINFDLIRPTAATFAEYFVNRFITLADYHIYIHNWYNGQCYHCTQCCLMQHQQPAQLCCCFNVTQPQSVNWYTCYEIMVADLSEVLLHLVDLSLNDMRYSNVRPSVIAAACIAAVRQLHHVRPVWTPYLIKITECTVEIIAPIVEELVLLWRLHMCTPSSFTTACESPDSGIVLDNDLTPDEAYTVENKNNHSSIPKKRAVNEVDSSDGTCEYIAKRKPC